MISRNHTKIISHKVITSLGERTEKRQTDHLAEF